MNSTKPRINQRKIADAANIDRAFFNKIIHVKASCPKKTALLLEKITGVDRSIWIFEPEKIKSLLEKRYAS